MYKPNMFSVPQFMFPISFRPWTEKERDQVRKAVAAEGMAVEEHRTGKWNAYRMVVPFDILSASDCAKKDRLAEKLPAFQVRSEYKYIVMMIRK